MRLMPVAAAGLAALMLAACSGAEEPPAAEETVPGAASAMAEVENVRFDLAVDGDVPGLDISSADGVVTADGDAEGTGVITAMGMDVEVEYVIVGEDAYVKGFTGDYQQIPLGDEMLPYDPTVLLAPDRGIAELLAAYDSAEPQETEEVDGTDAYRYRVTFDPQVFADFIPAEGDWNEATVWFDTETLRVVKAEFEEGGATVTLRLSDYDDSVTVEAP
ncbi:LppX_LprAFG lipoprotein [Glycomyces sp. L485]|uniref:LppX_LprAFG lipoprotein n=1 Tax=Glycomyces sp. L485 TaxID=2909235 RepID=UPI001F4A7511|nr:LppX_LprAFG lipoprotein [Glycomyces sp. L485]MCH7232965.1 LppX_LprAFG lipoprotein [Glycomyces sp. L485]